MARSEFSIIEQYFTSIASTRSDVALGIGDDCALLTPPQDRQLAVSMDTLVAGRHFPLDRDPFSIGHKSLAVNLSDLAAMGAEPAWATLALTLPQIDNAWLEQFAAGFSALARCYDVALVGGDTTRGPLSVTVQVHGFVNQGKALLRSGARPGDVIYVTGKLGDAALALDIMQGQAAPLDDLASLSRSLDLPKPRVAQGLVLAGLANSAIDISDGLLADLGHICQSSSVGACIYLQQLPVSPMVRERIQGSGDWSLPLARGDDYELCFTVSSTRQEQLESVFRDRGFELWPVGRIEQGAGIRLIDAEGKSVKLQHSGFDHFSHE